MLSQIFLTFESTKEQSNEVARFVTGALIQIFNYIQVEKKLILNIIDI